MQTSQERARSEYDLDRLVVFSDAVFAIVITLLVLPLATAVDLHPGDLLPQVLSLWPRALAFVVSFLVVGQFWIVHHRMYGRFVGCDRGLVWVDLLSLLTVSFMPFPTAVLGERTDAADQFPVVFYAMSLTVASISLTVTWLYALRRGLVDPGMTRTERDQHLVRSVVSLGVFAASIGAAFLGLLPAMVCWLVLMPLARSVAIRLRRPHEAIEVDAR